MFVSQNPAFRLCVTCVKLTFSEMFKTCLDKVYQRTYIFSYIVLTCLSAAIHVSILILVFSLN